MDRIKLEKLKELMEASNIDQLLISDPTSVFYLTGKWTHPGERLYALVIGKNGKYDMFAHQMFSIDDVKDVNKNYFKDTEDPVKKLSESIIEKGSVNIDLNWPSRFMLRLIELKPNVNFVSKPIIEAVRRVKTEEEKRLMREASKTNDKSMEMITKSFDPSWNEKIATAKLAEIYEKLETEGFSFDPIICFGANTSDAHHITDETFVKEGDAMVFDIGCVKNSYCSDMTRTFFFKSASKKQREVYSIVLDANKKAIEAVKPGKKFSEIDAVARDYITEKGYGEYFTHRLGHCLGLEVHEHGDVSAANDDIIKEGMVFSIEPGIYLPGDFGVRIEDIVIATSDGCENLNGFSKELQILGN